MEEDKLSKLAVDILLTWRCNLRCKKCCVPKTGPEASLEEFKAFFDKLREIEMKRVVLTGGEPLMRHEVVEIAKYAKERGFEIYLSTNGILIKQLWKELAPYISWISLSLDSHDKEINRKIIGKNSDLHFQRNIEFLEYYGNLPEKTAKIKLATVIMKKNKDSLVSLGRLIFEEQQGYRPDIWRLYQFSNQFSDATSAGHSYLTENHVSEEEAETRIKTLREALPHVEISYRPAESRDESFIFVTPDLNLTYPSKTKYISFGDTKKMSANEIKKALYSVEHIWGKIITNREIYK